MSPIGPSITRLFGIELEYFIINRKGEISNKADMVIRDLKNKFYESGITNESGQSMIEVLTFPHRSSREAFSGFFKDFESLLYELETNDLGLFYYGTYPGKNSNKMRSQSRYKAQAKILGEEEYENSGRGIGVHYHYSLPRKSYNKNINFLYPDLSTRKKKKILNLFNLYIGIDPALCTFMQSSPYHEGKYYGKDARMMIRRGDPIFRFKKSLYSRYPEFAKLNEYASDYKDLIRQIKDRSKKWYGILKEHDVSFSEFSKKGREVSLLDSSWNPVKISPHGTIESRSADMNSLNKIVAMSSIMKFISKYVQDKDITVKPGETGNDEPFKIEKDILHVPTRDKLSELQKNSAFFGLDNEEVKKHSKALLDLMKKISSVESRAPLRVFKKMLTENKTTSDEIIDFVKKKQGKDNYKVIEQETARELALECSKNVFKDLLITKKMAEKNLIFG